MITLRLNNRESKKLLKVLSSASVTSKEMSQVYYRLEDLLREQQASRAEVKPLLDDEFRGCPE